MSSLTFHLKRAYFDAVAKLRPVAAAHGLTPGRIDLLHAIHVSASPPTQRELRRVLCVTSSTLTDMMRGVEALGLVTRRTSPVDRRAKIVELTAEGQARLRRALHDVLGEAA